MAKDPAPVPLCVDLAGTLSRADMLVISVQQLVRAKPYDALALPFWLLRGRAALKREIAERVRIDPSTLPYNAEFLAWLRGQHAGRRMLVLATASDQTFADAIAAHLGIFDEVIGSDGLHNRKGQGKLDELRRRYSGGFDYAGNSSADLPLWRACRRAILVNAPEPIRQRARAIASVEREFD
jgi:phosphoserine phosphatase